MSGSVVKATCSFGAGRAHWLTDDEYDLLNRPPSPPSAVVRRFQEPTSHETTNPDEQPPPARRWVQTAPVDLAGAAGVVGWTARAKFRAAEDLTASAFSPDLSAVVVAGPDELVHVYDRDTGVAIRQFAGCDKNTTVDALAFGPRGLLLTGGSDRNARVWDLSSGAHTLVATLPHPRGVRAVAHSPATGTVATGCLDGVVRLYHETGGDALFVGDGAPGAANPSVEALSFSRSGSQLASCGYGYSIKVWPGYSSKVSCVTFSEDDSLLATGGWNCVVTLWTLIRRGSPSAHSEPRPLSAELLATGCDEIVCVWETTHGTLRHALPSGLQTMHTIAFGVDEQLVLAGALDTELESDAKPNPDPEEPEVKDARAAKDRKENAASRGGFSTRGSASAERPPSSPNWQLSSALSSF